MTLHDYETTKHMYDTIHNKNTSLVQTSNDEPTPMACIEEMVATIPDTFWQRSDLKILDPCCGCGNFLVVILHHLRRYHPLTHILENILYFNDINQLRLEVVKTMFQHDTYSLQLQQTDFLEYDESTKYDLIVANPPYAKLLPSGKRASKNHNLIGPFIRKSLQILQTGGYLLYITPDNWMSFADRNTLIQQLTSLQIVHINIHTAKKYFKKIGSSFVWYLIENTPHYRDIQVEGIWKGHTYTDTVQSQTRTYIPLFYNRTIQSILNKTIDADNQKFQVQTSSDLHRYTKKHLISNQQDEEHPYKLIHTPKQTVWSSRPHKFQEGYKVFLSTTSYYGTSIDNCGMTQSIAFIQCDDQAHAQQISHILSHPLYVFINNICRYGNFNNIRILQHFPYCTDYDKVYETFHITPEEAQFIRGVRPPTPQLSENLAPGC